VLHRNPVPYWPEIVTTHSNTGHKVYTRRILFKTCGASRRRWICCIYNGSWRSWEHHAIVREFLLWVWRLMLLGALNLPIDQYHVGIMPYHNERRSAIMSPRVHCGWKRSVTRAIYWPPHIGMSISKENLMGHLRIDFPDTDEARIVQKGECLRFIAFHSMHSFNQKITFWVLPAKARQLLYSRQNSFTSSPLRVFPTFIFLEENIVNQAHNQETFPENSLPSSSSKTVSESYERPPNATLKSLQRSSRFEHLCVSTLSTLILHHLRGSQSD
jgi:hypothetical protein